MIDSFDEMNKKMPKGWILDKYFTGNQKRDFESLYDFVVLVRNGRKDFLIASAYMPENTIRAKAVKTVRLVASSNGFEVCRYTDDLRSPTSKKRIDSNRTEDAIRAFVEEVASV